MEEDKETEERVVVKEREQEDDKRGENVKECEQEEGEEITLKEQPKIKNPRRRRNIIVGWLCSKIVKAFVKNKILL